MTDHAKLSASGSATWLYCPAAPRICAGLPEETSPYAEEGTRAHAQAEAMLRGVEGPHPELGRDVMPYYELVRSLVGQDDTLSIEQQVSFDEWVPGGRCLFRLEPGRTGAARQQRFAAAFQSLRNDVSRPSSLSGCAACLARASFTASSAACNCFVASDSPSATAWS